MEMLDIQRGHILVRIDGRAAKIDGEGFSRQLLWPGQDESKYVDFVVYADTLAWEKPRESEDLPAVAKASILAFLKDEFQRRGQLLAVE
jgi:hypothetical protein